MIFIELAMLVLPFALTLERHDYETDEYVYHEERDDYYINDVVTCDYRAKVVYWTVILAIWVDRYV